MNETRERPTGADAVERIELAEMKRTPVHRFDQCFHRDHRYCDCAMPMTLKKWNDALGTFVVLRVCCMARAVETLTGIPLLEIFDFPPRWVWDCTEKHQATDEEGTVILKERGAPPRWLRQRLQEKGIEIKNLPADT